jgi:hypothetical protein
VALAKRVRRGQLSLRPTFRRVMEFIYSYYDLIFAFCIILGCGSLSCRWIEVANTSNNASSLTRGFTSDFFSAFEYETAEGTVPLHVNFLHDEIVCLSSRDIILKIFGFIMLISSLILRVVFSKLRRFSRNPLCFDSSLDSSDMAQEIIINLSLVITHMLSVVLPSNRTEAQKAQILLDYNEATTRIIQNVSRS